MFTATTVLCNSIKDCLKVEISLQRKYPVILNINLKISTNFVCLKCCEPCSCVTLHVLGAACCLQLSSGIFVGSAKKKLLLRNGEDLLVKMWNSVRTNNGIMVGTGFVLPLETLENCGKMCPWNILKVQGSYTSRKSLKILDKTVSLETKFVPRNILKSP